MSKLGLEAATAQLLAVPVETAAANLHHPDQQREIRTLALTTREIALIVLDKGPTDRLDAVANQVTRATLALQLIAANVGPMPIPMRASQRAIEPIRMAVRWLRDYTESTLPPDTLQQIDERVQARIGLLEQQKKPGGLEASDPAFRELPNRVATVESGIAGLERRLSFAGEEGIEGLFRRVTQKERELDAAIIRFKEVEASVSLTGYATIYNDRAKEHKTASRLWLGGAAGMLVISAVLAFVLYDLAYPETIPADDDLGRIQFAVLKLVVFSLSLAAAYWCARQYRSHKHNEIVNRHREAAIGSFAAFADATKDPVVKDKLLLAAVTAIYGAHSTGQVETESSAAPITQIFETFTSAAKGEK